MKDKMTKSISKSQHARFWCLQQRNPALVCSFFLSSLFFSLEPHLLLPQNKHTLECVKSPNKEPFSLKPLNKYFASSPPSHASGRFKSLIQPQAGQQPHTTAVLFRTQRSSLGIWAARCHRLPPGCRPPSHVEAPGSPTGPGKASRARGSRRTRPRRH